MEKKCTEYNSDFKKARQKNLPIFPKYDNDGNGIGAPLRLKPDEEFKQIYNRNSEERKYFNKYLFVSNHGNMVSMFHENQPEWRAIDYTKNYDSGRGHLRVGPGQKTLASYNITGLVFGSERYGKADALLKKHGVDALGKKKDDSDDTKVVGHHIEGWKKPTKTKTGKINKKSLAKNQEDNNNPELLEFVTKTVHDKVLHSTLKAKTLGEDIALMSSDSDLMKIIAEEEPENATFFMPELTAKERKELEARGIDLDKVSFKGGYITALPSVGVRLTAKQDCFVLMPDIDIECREHWTDTGRAEAIEKIKIMLKAYPDLAYFMFDMETANGTHYDVIYTAQNGGGQSNDKGTSGTISG